MLLESNLKLSFRSNNRNHDGGYNVFRLVQALGGGEHKNAAGTSINIKQAMDIFGSDRLIAARHSV